MADSRIDDLRRRLERDPGSRLFAQLAEEHRKAGDHAEAVRVARAGLVHHPSYPSARLTLGRALLDAGDASGARVELEAALRDAPDNILASRFLGQALEATGQLGLALLQLQKTLKMAPGDRQLESQIVALQARLRTAPAPVPSATAVTGPLPSVSAVAGPLPLAQVAAGDGEAGPQPVSIRTHMPGDQWSRAPRTGPPPLPASAAPPVRAGAPSPPAPVGPAASVNPPPAPAAAKERVATASPPATEEVDGASRRPQTWPLFAEPYYESDVAPTLPTAQVPESAAASEAFSDPTLPSEPTLPPEPRLPREPPREDETAFEEAAAPPPTPLASSTLAELYYRQGLGGQAAGVYRQLLAEEPGNEKARARLAEIEAEAAPRREDPRAVRRKALERTIAGLEALLAALRRR